MKVLLSVLATYLLVAMGFHLGGLGFVSPTIQGCTSIITTTAIMTMSLIGIHLGVRSMTKRPWVANACTGLAAIPIISVGVLTCFLDLTRHTLHEEKYLEAKPVAGLICSGDHHSDLFGESRTMHLVQALPWGLERRLGTRHWSGSEDETPFTSFENECENLLKSAGRAP